MNPTTYITAAPPTIPPLQGGSHTVIYRPIPCWPQAVQQVFQHPSVQFNRMPLLADTGPRPHLYQVPPIAFITSEWPVPPVPPHVNATATALQSSHNADMNCYWLSHHLEKLADTAPSERYKHPRVKCVERAVRYFLTFPDEFKSNTAKSYPHLANQLSKFCGNKLCMQALAFIAQYLAQVDDLALLNNKSLALLTCAFVKHQYHHDCRERVFIIADILAQRCAWLGNQDLSLCLNAVSKWPEYPQSRTVGLILAERIATDDVLRRKMTPQCVSNSLNALSKWPEAHAAKAAAIKLAQHIAEASLLRQKMQAQAVSNCLNALCKWSREPEVQTAIITLARRISEDGVLRQAMTTQNVSNALNALSKYPALETVRTAALLLAERIITDQAWRQRMSLQEVSNSLNALSHWAGQPQAKTVMMLLTTRITTDRAIQSKLTLREINGIIFALHRWSEDEQARTTALLLAKQIAADNTRWQEMTEDEIHYCFNVLTQWNAEDSRTSTATSAIPQR